MKNSLKASDSSPILSLSLIVGLFILMIEDKKLFQFIQEHYVHLMMKNWHDRGWWSNDFSPIMMDDNNGDCFSPAFLLRCFSWLADEWVPLIIFIVGWFSCEGENWETFPLWSSAPWPTAALMILSDAEVISGCVRPRNYPSCRRKILFLSRVTLKSGSSVSHHGCSGILCPNLV